MPLYTAEHTSGVCVPLLPITDLIGRSVNLIQVLLTVLTSSSAVAKRPHDASCLSVVSFNIICYTFTLDLPLCQLNYVLFGVSLVYGFLCRKQTCIMTWYTTGWTTVSWRRSIAGYRPTIAFIAAFTACKEARYWLRIPISVHPVCILRPR